MSQNRNRIRAALEWAPYSWVALPIVAGIAFSRYGWPLGLAGWWPFLSLLAALFAVERSCLQLFSAAAGKRSQTPRDLGYQLTLAFGFALVLWCYREFMNQALQG